MATDLPNITQSEFQQVIKAELTGNILPFWMRHAVDDLNGGFYGALTIDLQVNNEVPRSAVICARILWTYANAYHRLGDEAYLAMARRAFAYLSEVFWDKDNKGVYWSVDLHGAPVFDRKHHYAQAFAIYGLSEYYRVTQDPNSLELAQTLFHLLEAYAYDSVNGGYIEASSRTWGVLADMRLSERDMDGPKSMNTMLHILEAYTNLLRVWDDSYLRARHRALIDVFHQHIFNHETGHFKLMFNDQWRPLTELVSYGHDIEASWLLYEAAELHHDRALLAQTRQTALTVADAVYRTGLDDDGSMFYEGGPQGVLDTDKDWWVQAEAMVGFYNAYQLSGKAQFAHAAVRIWNFIQAHQVDHTHGDWYKKLNRDGLPDMTHYKVGPWECPYHQSRACFEMIERLETMRRTTALHGIWTGTAHNTNGFDLQINVSFVAPCEVGSACLVFTIPEIPCTGTFRLVRVVDDTFEFVAEDKQGPCGQADLDSLQRLADGTLLYVSRGDGWEASGALHRTDEV
jgi:cellobiose epimerase